MTPSQPARKGAQGVLLALLSASTLGSCGLARDRVASARAARLAELRALPAGALAGARELDLEVACRLAELHLLEGGSGGALAVDCSGARLAQREGGAWRLSDVLAHTSLDQALLGDGGFRRQLCIAPTSAGWTVLGEAFELDECDFALVEGASPEVQAAAAREGLARAREAMAREGLSRAQAAMAGASRLGALPTRCPSLTETPARRLGVVDRRVLEGDPEAGREVAFTHLAFRACLDPTPGAEGCSLLEPWRYALVLEVVEAERPVAVDARTFRGGQWRGFAGVVDLEAQALLCRRPVAAELTLATAPGYDYDREVGAALCEAVAELGGGKLALDPYWGCG